MTIRNRVVYASVAAVIPLFAVLAVGDEAPPAPKPYDFNKVASLGRDSLDVQERTKLGIAYLREEIAEPTPPIMMLGGGINPHDYIIAQLVLATARPYDGPGMADSEMLFQELQRQTAGEYRDALALTLGLARDSRMTKYTLAYLQDTGKPPVLRERAARALGYIGDPETVPFLVNVLLGDPIYQIQRADRGPQHPLVRYHPVREAARENLRGMKADGIALGAQAEQALQQAQVRVPIPAELQQALDRQLQELAERRFQAREKGEPIPPTQYYRDR